LSSGTDEENTMLDITLNMLRCSVCKDRFKEVAITRCFHLFCKECIDENLRNRSRKCPACGEKFGQDDVKQVYFTS
jgi:E3 ubiquitin-protein ligase BRE1